MFDPSKALDGQSGPEQPASQLDTHCRCHGGTCKDGLPMFLKQHSTEIGHVDGLYDIQGVVFQTFHPEPGTSVKAFLWCFPQG